LEQESIRTLYRNRLKGKLIPLTGEIDTDWLNMKDAIIKALQTFIALCCLQSQAKKDKLQSYWSTGKSTEISFLL